MATRPPPPADLDLRDLDLDKEPKPRPKPKHDGLHIALAGALSGAASRTLVAPFDRVKLLAQVAAVPGSLSTSTSGSSSSSFSSATSSSSSSAVANATARRSTATTLRAIYEADGVRGLFRGNVAALLRTIPYSAVQLSTHDLLKRRIAASSSESAKRGEGGSSTTLTSTSSTTALPTGARLAAAAGAGVAAAAVSHPLDTLRLRLALPTATATATAATGGGNAAANAAAARAAASSSLITTAATVVRNEGFFSLYRGLSAAVLGAAPFSAISLMTFDRLQSLAASKRRREWSERQLLREEGGEEEGEGEEGGELATTMAMNFLPATATTTATSSSLSNLAPPQAPAWEAALAGAFAGAVASTATYPIDTLRRRLQLPTSTSVAGCVGVVPEGSSNPGFPGSGAAAASEAVAAARADSLRSSHTRSLFSAAATAIRHDGFFSLYRGWVVGELLKHFFSSKIPNE